MEIYLHILVRIVIVVALGQDPDLDSFPWDGEMLAALIMLSFIYASIESEEIDRERSKNQKNSR